MVLMQMTVENRLSIDVFHNLMHALRYFAKVSRNVSRYRRSKVPAYLLICPRDVAAELSPMAVAGASDPSRAIR